MGTTIGTPFGAAFANGVSNVASDSVPASVPLVGLDALLAAPSPLQNLMEEGNAPAGSLRTHVVEIGQTLGDIADLYGTTTQMLGRLNALSAADLSVGQVLRLPEQVVPAIASFAGSSFHAVTATVSGVSQGGLDFLHAHEAVAGVTDRLHWPGGSSGVRLGAGYDMKARATGQIVDDLIAVGVGRVTAELAAGGAGLAGTAARDFVIAHRDALTLTRGQERQLLGMVIGGCADHVRARLNVAVTQNQFDALVSFAFAIGRSAFDRSMTLRKLNADDVTGAAAAMALAITSGGWGAQGQVSRRADEIQLFNTPGRMFGSDPGNDASVRTAGNVLPDGSLAATTPADYARIIAARGDQQANADLAAGRKVVVALRAPIQAGGSEERYDDCIAVVWKQADAGYRAETFAGNTKSFRRYADGGPRPDDRVDFGGLRAGTIRYRQEADHFLGNTYFRAISSGAASGSTSQNALYDARDGKRIDVTGTEASLLVHQGGVTNTYSAGSQTLARDQFNSFVRALGGQPAFSYVLVDAE